MTSRIRNIVRTSRIALAFASLLAVLALSASSASAGTLYATATCPNMNTNNQYCSGEWYPDQARTGYIRFGTVNQYSWYPSHRAYLFGFDNVSYWGWYYGSWTSARFAYSPIINTFVFSANGQLNTTTTEKRTYNLQAFLGTY